MNKWAQVKLLCKHTKVHISELQMTIDPSSFGGRVEVLKCLFHVFVDVSAVEVHETESRLANRIVFICCCFEVFEGSCIVLGDGLASFEVHLYVKCMNKASTVKITAKESPCRGKPLHGHRRHLRPLESSGELAGDLAQRLVLLGNEVAQVLTELLHHLSQPIKTKLSVTNHLKSYNEYL